jgi:alkylation response protein AidB-like acyl-CoA dehydrogenase
VVRTDPAVPKHKGLTVLLVDMHSPGVEVRPLRQMTGHAKFDEVFLDEVVVPDDQRLGAVNGGWRCARTTLTSERGAVGRNTSLRGGSFAMLHTAARQRGQTADPTVRQRLAQLYTVERIAAWLAGRTRDAKGRGGGPTGAIAKLHATIVIRLASRLGADLAGASGVAWEASADGADEWGLRLCAVPGLSIGGGTDEIVRNTVGEKVLGLPREPMVDRDARFDEHRRSG